MALKRKRYQGFSLIEVIISIAILAILVVAILSSMNFNFSHVLTMGRKTEAVQKAQAFLEAAYTSGIASIDSVATEMNCTYVSPGPLQASLYQSSQPNDVMFYAIEAKNSLDPESLDTVSVLVFYQSGSRFVTLSGQVP